MRHDKIELVKIKSVDFKLSIISLYRIVFKCKHSIQRSLIFSTSHVLLYCDVLEPAYKVHRHHLYAYTYTWTAILLEWILLLLLLHHVQHAYYYYTHEIVCNGRVTRDAVGIGHQLGPRKESSVLNADYFIVRSHKIKRRFRHVINC